MENIEIKELTLSDINDNLFDNFNRYQKSTKSWYKINGNWALINEEDITDWDKNQKDYLIKLFFDTIIEKRGYLFGAYKDKKLIGFSVLLNDRFGTKGQYVNLAFLHISLDYRHKGLGKKLFGLCVDKAKENGYGKIYISANNVEESIGFYLKNGCKDAMEINKQLAEEEPTNRQLEYIIMG